MPRLTRPRRRGLQRRRLAAVAILGVLAATGLVACRSDPAVAAYVGDTGYTIASVDAVYDNARDTLKQAVAAERARQVDALTEQGEEVPAELLEPVDVEVPVSRQQIVDLLVSLDLGRRIISVRNVPLPEPQTVAADLSGAIGLPAEAEYVQLWAEWLDVQTAIVENTPRTELTDDGMMEVYQALVEAEAMTPGMSVEQVREAFAPGIFVEAALLLASSIDAEAEQVDISVNPKYQPLGVPLAVNTGQRVAFYSLPYAASDFVTDAAAG